MHSLEAEISELQKAGVIDEATAARAAALERGSVFSVFEELRAGMYAGVALITTGLGIFIGKNLDRIGPLTIVTAIAFVAALCYGSAVRAHRRGAERSLGGDYILLLGALLVSTDLGYAESQFHWLGSDWSRYLLLLAVWHTLTAYWLNSRLVLSVALTSLAGWFGVERRFGILPGLDRMSWVVGWRALGAAAVILGWSELNRRFSSRRQFQEIFAHFIANLAFWGAVAWCGTASMRFPGAVLITAFGATAIYRGLRRAQEAFVIYGVCYAALGYCILAVQWLREPIVIAYSVLAIVIAAIVLLWQLHGRLKERGA